MKCPKCGRDINEDQGYESNIQIFIGAIIGIILCSVIWLIISASIITLVGYFK